MCGAQGDRQSFRSADENGGWVLAKGHGKQQESSRLPCLAGAEIPGLSPVVLVLQLWFSKTEESWVTLGAAACPPGFILRAQSM